jgi:hypothetical protein
MKAKFVALILGIISLFSTQAGVITTFTFDSLGADVSANTRISPTGSSTGAGVSAPYMTASRNITRFATGGPDNSTYIDFTGNGANVPSTGTLTFVLGSTLSSSTFQVTYYSKGTFTDASNHGATANTWAASTGTSTAAVSITPAYSNQTGWTAYTVSFTFASPVQANQVTFTDSWSGQIGNGQHTSFDGVEFSDAPEPTNIALGIFGLGFVSVAAGRKYLRKRAPVAA